MNMISFRKFMNNIMKNKRLTVIIIALLLSIIYMATFVTPNVYITTQIQDITDKGYDAFVKNSKVPLEKKTRDNCRFISINMKVTKPILFIKNVKIEKVTLNEYLDEIQYFNNETNEFKHLGSHFSSSNNKFFDGIDVYSDGITDEKLKDFFKDYKVEITWTNVLTGKNKEVYYLKDYFQ
ncbi:hypothetical protein [Clostridium sp.]|uniref:hypothetical protein n=1 Tax=Clostridium sp. TaxID=1506 RepID=UPI002FC91AE4